MRRSARRFSPAGRGKNPIWSSRSASRSKNPLREISYLCAITSEYQSLLETLNILADADTMAIIAEAERDVAAGELFEIDQKPVAKVRPETFISTFSMI